MSKLQTKEIKAKDLTVEDRIVVDNEKFVYYRNMDNTIEEKHQVEILDILGIHKVCSNEIVVVALDGKRRIYPKDTVVMVLGGVEEEKEIPQDTDKRQVFLG